MHGEVVEAQTSSIPSSSNNIGSHSTATHVDNIPVQPSHVQAMHDLVHDALGVIRQESPTMDGTIRGEEDATTNASGSGIVNQ